MAKRGRKPWRPTGNLHIDAATIPLSRCTVVKYKSRPQVNYNNVFRWYFAMKCKWNKKYGETKPSTLYTS